MSDHRENAPSDAPFVCPKCNGQKQVWAPRHVPGDQPTYSSSGLESYTCPVCKGEGVLWRSVPSDAGSEHDHISHPWFGCFTGDCPHDTQVECDAAIAAEFALMEHAVHCERSVSPVSKAPEWMHVDRGWREYPIGTLARNHNGMRWEKVRDGWRAIGGDTFPTPAADALEVLVLMSGTGAISEQQMVEIDLGQHPASGTGGLSSHSGTALSEEERGFVERMRALNLRGVDKLTNDQFLAIIDRLLSSHPSPVSGLTEIMASHTAESIDAWVNNHGHYSIEVGYEVGRVTLCNYDGDEGITIERDTFEEADALAQRLNAEVACADDVGSEESERQLMEWLAINDPDNALLNTDERGVGVLEHADVEIDTGAPSTSPVPSERDVLCVCGHERQAHGTIYQSPDEKTGACLFRLGEEQRCNCLMFHAAHLCSPVSDEIPDGVALIAAERKRQVYEEDWTADHDDEHEDESLAIVASLYAMPYDERAVVGPQSDRRGVPIQWPESWDSDWWKPATSWDSSARIRELTKAGALIAAEIDRLQRALSDTEETNGNA